VKPSKSIKNNINNYFSLSYTLWCSRVKRFTKLTHSRFINMRKKFRHIPSDSAVTGADNSYAGACNFIPQALYEIFYSGAAVIFLIIKDFNQ